ncbi:MAG TPA: DoxX family membrane protein [Phototrophicaceae bacterium]|nr:DoxX family membrane protein [Phototrophicaceae bacterium]
MSISRRLARPLLASSFVATGVDALLHPDSHVDKFRKIEPTLEKAGVPPAIASDTRLLVRVTGGVTALAGLMLATNRNPRSAALTLAALTVPVTLVNNPVWTATGKDRKKEMRRGLLTGASLVGGLLIAGLDRDGRPSLAWRASNTREHKAALREVRAAAKETKADLKAKLG